MSLVVFLTGEYSLLIVYFRMVAPAHASADLMDEIWSLSSLFIRYILGLVAIKEYIYIIFAQFFLNFMLLAFLFIIFIPFFTESQRDIIPNDNVYNNKFNYAVS